MKTLLLWNQITTGPLTCAALLAAGLCGSAAEPEAQTVSKEVRLVVAHGDDAAATNSAPEKHRAVVVKAIEPVHAPGHLAHRELPWLGVGTDEAAEVVTAQLGLDPGVGLVVNYVAAKSPAAKAGLQKNDVLVELEGQSLVHPAQLRKLVQARKEGDTVKLVYYRAGQKHTATATLGKTSAGFGLLGDEHSWGGDLKELHLQLRGLPIRDTIREQMEIVRKSLGDVKIDQQKTKAEIERSIEQARKALREALKQKSDAVASSDSMSQALKELEHLGGDVDKHTTVTIRKSDKATKSLVKTDDSGTIVIVNKPKLRLTAHDKDGKLLFDGEIETDEQRAKVPPEVWKEAEPLLKKLQGGTKDADTIEADDDAAALDEAPPAGNEEALLCPDLVIGRRVL